MILNELGYPKPTGASDWEDSSHLAGILAVTECLGPFFEEDGQRVFDQAISCKKYVMAGHDGYYYVRVFGSKYNFSRDQFICLAAGLYKQGLGQYVDFDYVTGNDVMPPSVRGMVAIIKGGQASWFQKLWFKAELLFHALHDPTGEPFQIMAMCEVYGTDFYKLWTGLNPLWRDAINRYFCEGDGAWRNEPELAAHAIKYVESKLV